MPRRGPVLIALVLAIAAALARPAASAVDAPALRGELQARSQARDDARAQSQALQTQIAQLSARLAGLATLTASGADGIAGRRARLTALNAREAALRARMGANQGALADLLGALELYRRDPPPALLVTPRSAKDAVRAAILVRAASPELARRAAAFRAQAADLQRLRREMDAISEDLFTSESALAEGRAALERQLREKIVLQRQMDADALAADRSAQMLAGELRAMGAPLSGPIVKAGAPAHAPAFLAAPVEGTLIRRFGQGGAAARSDGLSWRAAPGAVVRAPAAGLVEYAGALKGWGEVVIMDVGGGYHLVLAGLARSAASTGQSITAGRVLGAMASDGGAAPELYLELRKDGAPQDPQRWLRSPPLAHGPLRR